MATQQDKATEKAAEQGSGLTQADVDKAVAEAVAKVEQEFQAKVAEANAGLLAQIEELAAQQGTGGGSVASGSSDGSDSTEGLEEYELLLPVYHRIISAPGKATQVVEYHYGEKIPLDPDRAKEFIADGVVKDPSGQESPAKPTAQTRRPVSR